MMFRNSYISNSSYFAALIYFSVMWCAVAFFLTGTSDKISSTADDKLFEYQLHKLENAKDVDTIFLGDSSLGNAINAELWEDLSGRKSLNLALTGAYGYEGAYIMLLNAISKNKIPKNVILFFEPQQMLGNISYISFLKSPQNFEQQIPLHQKILLYWKMNMNPESLREKLNTLLTVKKDKNRKINFANDYMAQNHSTRSTKRFYDLREEKTANDLNPEKFKYLKKINDLCKDHNIRCSYIHGPIIKKTCKKLIEFTKAGEIHIKKTGIDFIENNFYCTPNIDMGDTATHLHPQVKDKYTKKYFEIISSKIY